MTDALTAAPATPQTDALGDDTSLPNAQTNTIPLDDGPEVPPDQKRSNAVNKAIDDALGDDDGEKPKPKPKAETKPKVAPVKAEQVKPDAKPAPDAARDAETAPSEAVKPPPRPTAYREPPSGFDDAAKGEWEAVPESVRGAVHRRAQEMEQGIQKYRADAQEYEPVRRYAEMARQSGTTLDKALGRYVGMEQRLRQDLIGGLEDIVANIGLRKADGSAVSLRDVAANIMGQTPDQASSRQDGTIQFLRHELAEIKQQMGGFSQHIEGQKQRAQYSAAEGEWGSFQQQYPRARELEGPIAEFLTKYPAPANIPASERLSDAYNWAVARNPSVAHTDPPPLVQTQTPAFQNPAGQKSISGAPGGNDATTVPRNLNRSAAVEKAMRAAGL